MSLTTIPKVTWGSAFSSSLEWGWRPDFPVSYSKPMQGSEVNVQYISGIEDAWIIDTEFYFELDMRWIPSTNESGSFGVQTGWNGETGVRAFIENARDANEVRVYLDKDSPTYIASYLTAPGIDDVPTLEADGTRRIRLIFRNISGSYDI